MAENLFGEPTSSPYCWELMQTLDKSRKENSLSDVTLDVGGQMFLAHRCVLAAGSKFFHGLFTSDMTEKSAPVVKLEGIPASVMSHLLSYLYTGEIHVSEANAEDLIASANYLLLPQLKNIACKFLERRMSASNSIFNYLFAEKYECKDLQSYAGELIMQNFGVVGRSKEFLLLSFDLVKDLISRDDIVISSEEEVFEIILEWIDENFAEREQYFAELFSHVRLSTISHHYLYTKMLCNELVQGIERCRQSLMDEVRRRALFEGLGISPQKSRTCLQTHEDAIITCGGLSPDGQIRNSTLCYVPSNKTWYQLAPMLSRRCRHGFSACKGFVYAIGGKGEDSFHSSVERYDPRTNTWSYVAPLAKKVKLVGAATLQGFLYIVGGIEFTPEQGRRRCSTTQKYDPETNSWMPAASLPSRRSSVCLISDAHYLYSVGGLGDDDFLSCNERYDPKLNIWTKMASMKEKRGCACGLCLNNKIYIFGGTVDAFSRHASVSGEVYDIALDEWHAIASMRVPRFHASAVLLRDQIFVFGGIGSESVQHHNSQMVECYDVQTNQWITSHSMPYEETYFRGCGVSLFRGLLQSLKKVPQN
ncbi:kelch-like protein diablo [Montipora foliosa]|uniref:kelch-like protein diablo n=1 Tax=Montipora foliosa TaxID=591990 RepID=UPI0035F1D329